MVARLVDNRRGNPCGCPSWAGTRPAPTFYWSVGQICVPYEVVLEKPSFQEKTRFQFVDVYTKIAVGYPAYEAPNSYIRVGQDARPTNYFVGEASCLDSTR